MSAEAKERDEVTIRAPAIGDVKSADKFKRYNLSLHNELFEEIQQIADTEGITMLELLRKFIKLGLMAYQLSKQPDSALIIRQGEKEREIVLI